MTFPNFRFWMLDTGTEKFSVHPWHLLVCPIFKFPLLQSDISTTILLSQAVLAEIWSHVKEQSDQSLPGLQFVFGCLSIWWNHSSNRLITAMFWVSEFLLHDKSAKGPCLPKICCFCVCFQWNVKIILLICIKNFPIISNKSRNRSQLKVRSLMPLWHLSCDMCQFMLFFKWWIIMLTEVLLNSIIKLHSIKPNVRS